MATVHRGVSSMLEFHNVRFCFFIYINDPTENLQSNPKIFASDTSLFVIMNGPNATAKQLCEDLGKRKEWTFKWKISFSADLS